MRLQRDVAEILQGDDAELVRVGEDARHGHRHRLEQAGDVDERELLEGDRPRVHGEHLRRVVRHEHAEVAPVRGVAGERHHGRAALREAAVGEKLIDSGPHVGHSCRHVRSPGLSRRG